MISELRKQAPQKSVLSWFDSCKEEQLYTSSLCIGELHYGISILPDGRKRNDLLVWFDEVCEAFSNKILPITATICIIWGHMRARARRDGKTLPVIDGLLAATAQVHDMILVTRNTADVEITGVRVLNPWKE
ncbi:MAG TPA: type II toxin-antitoxin system VapC family toxin [Firmicutes bacterium]|nr:type II toxin-antitoxin system VapC family toxin [Bacillota bacterium]